MSKEIISCVKLLIERVRSTGKKNGNSLELANQTLTDDNVNYSSLMQAVVEYYGNDYGLLFQKKSDQEKYHYRFLEFGLLQKIEYNRFYFKEEPIGSRKIFINSQDCITNVSILPRKKEMFINISMRSSDIEQLLIPDIVGVLKIVFHSVIPKIYNETPKVSLKVNICSAHLYPDRDPRRIRYTENE